MPLLFLVLASGLLGALGAYVISRVPFRALATEGTPGFASTLTQRREAIHGWIGARRHRTTAASLAFSAALAVFVAGWASLGLLAYLVREHASGLVRIDSAVARWGAAHATAFSDRAVQLVTLVGDTYIVAGLAALFAGVEWLRRRNGRVVLFLVAVVVGDGLITLAVKLLMHRARPSFNPIAAGLGPSFPSGHASLAAAFFAAAALLLSRCASRRRTAAFGAAAVAIAVAVAASRVFLDVHWVSDVAAGLGLGWAWFAFCAIAFGRLPRYGHGSA